MILITAFMIMTSLGSHAVAGFDEASWLTGLRKFDHISHPHKQQFIDLLLSVSCDATISGKVSHRCLSSLEDFATGLHQDDHKAMVMFDSFPKIRPGMITSQGYEFGSYQQCLSVGTYVYFGLIFPLPEGKVAASANTKTTWQSEYAKGMNVRKMTPYTSAICLPDGCDRKDIDTIISESDVMKQALAPFKLNILTTESRSQLTTPWSWVKIISVSLIAGQVLLCLAATISNSLDQVHPVSKKLLSFDLMTNCKTLFQDMREGSMSHRLASLNIFRIGYILAAMVFHTTIGMSDVLTIVTEHVASSSNLIAPIFPVIPASMTMNAILSACLSILTWLPVMRQRTVSFTQFTIMRIFRTLPVLIGFILVTQTLPLIQFGGPMMKHVQENTAQMCLNNGWAEVAFVSNYLPVSIMCNPVNWIVSLDMQLYVISFFMIKLMIHREKAGYIAVAAQVVLGSVASGLFSWYKDVPAVLSFSLKNVHQTYENYATITHHTIHYLAVYPLGTLMGYLFLKHGNKSSHGFLKATLAGLSSLFCLNLVANSYDEDMKFRYGDNWEWLFTATSRLLIALCATFIFYTLACASHPLVLAIARSKIVTVISRLSFSILVTHVLMIHFVIASFESLNSSPLVSSMMITFVTMFSFLTGLIMYLFVEAPYHNVLMDLTRGKRPLDQEEKRDQNNKPVHKKD